MYHNIMSHTLRGHKSHYQISLGLLRPGKGASSQNYYYYCVWYWARDTRLAEEDPITLTTKVETRTVLRAERVYTSRTLC
jgi:hypothetical protein